MRLSSSFLFAALIAGAGLVPSSVPADGPPSFEPRSSATEAEYTHTALDAYGTGYAFVERATRFEHDAAAAAEVRARAEAMRGMVQAFEDALGAFEEAVRAEPTMYEAHTYIGYANRKLGRHDAALAAYKRALTLKPDYARAIEYQGEAYLGLDRFENAKFNYLRLYALDAEQAQKLLDAMHLWVAQRNGDPREVTQAALKAASDWVASRPASELAARAGEADPW